MRILLVGSGGREHALAWKISQSPLCEQLWTAPGNPGTAAYGENLPIAADDLDGLVAFAEENQVGLVVVGPEGPLADGLVDRLIAADIPAFGPTAEAAELESSKAFCKEVLVRHRVPTASYRVYKDLNPAVSYLEGGARYPLVVKASGLAAGKGVVICPDAATAREAVKGMLEDGLHGAAGRTVVVEEFLQGPEASAFALTDGRTILPLESCQDHKQLREGDHGPNTGGMGAISPNPQVSDRTRDTIERQILLPTVHGLNHEGRRFRGVLFAGIKLTPAGPKVLEFNVRFGDPECQVLMMRLKCDLVPYLLACANGTLEELEAPEWDPRPAVTVVLASGGYPGPYAKGEEITGLDQVEQGPGLQVFQAGTAELDGKLVTAGGRVMAVTAVGRDLDEARELAYAAAAEIHFEGKTLRRDIGQSALASLEGFA
ncbi:MAG: phosphoribosylamine--glycine ligase [Planctomycetes bacterium]|nr:phosphoribosylamine--glycine ligase [Planctomycetota bacterium]MBL7009232.1 phosphoribosylamine--glycine ligase [Planctomycetota bacterium]